ncbi:MAG: bifunctional transcriptional activator/DNA repair enzyme AdaA [Myxococcota bacterium]
MNEQRAWEAVERRDAAADGAFVYGVTSTGIYCRPSCPSRRPRRERVRFFRLAVGAEHAGFRACRRCNPQGVEDLPVKVVRALCDELRQGKVPLPRLARRAGYSVAQVKRMFDEVLGLSPARFAEACRREALQHELRTSDSVALAIYGAGYSSPSQVYGSDALGMSPQAFARGGEREQVSFATGKTRFGWLLLAGTARGVCSVELGDDVKQLEQSLRRAFPKATVTRAEDAPALRRWYEALEATLEGKRAHPDLPLDVRTTAFRHRVYLALQAIPRGETRSYAEVARQLGAPRSTRAVARACASNQVAVLIPCHRVLRGDGALAGYRWGVERKRSLLDAESRAQAGR